MAVLFVRHILGCCSSACGRKKKAPGYWPLIRVSIRGLLLLDEDDVVLCGFAVDVHGVVVAMEHADDVRFARFLIQSGRIGVLIIDVVLVISEGDSEATFLGVTDNIVNDGLVEAVNVVNELAERGAVDECDGDEVSHDDTSLLQ